MVIDTMHETPVKLLLHSFRGGVISKPTNKLSGIPFIVTERITKTSQQGKLREKSVTFFGIVYDFRLLS